MHQHWRYGAYSAKLNCHRLTEAQLLELLSWMFAAMLSHTQVLAQPLRKARWWYHRPLWLLLQGRPVEVPTLQQPMQFTRAAGHGLHGHGLSWIGTSVRCKGGRHSCTALAH